MITLGLLSSAGAGILFYVTTAGLLGSDSPAISVLLGGVVLYLILLWPKRMLDSAALSQSREAPSLAAACSANLEATHSRPRSILLLDSRDETVRASLVEAKRRLLLGFGVGESLSLVRKRVVSQSAGDVLDSLTFADPRTIEEGGEETQNLAQASRLSEESKLPLFMAVAFFTPILLTLFAVLTHQSGPSSFAELVVLQLVVLDIAFYVSSAERSRLR
jgi:hypothetical protein